MTREQYLEKAIKKFSEMFKRHGYTVPKVKVSVGFPGGGKKRIGEHWRPEASSDKVGSIFISPVIDDGVEVLGVLIHEMVHAAVGNEAGHGPVFKKCALAVGLEGKMRSTTAGKDLEKVIKKTIRSIGKYPHTRLNLLKRPTKKQTTRMIKMECRECGFICRASMSKILEVGPPLCACNSEPLYFEAA